MACIIVLSTIGPVKTARITSGAGAGCSHCQSLFLGEIVNQKNEALHIRLGVWLVRITRSVR